MAMDTGAYVTLAYIKLIVHLGGLRNYLNGGISRLEGTGQSHSNVQTLWQGCTSLITIYRTMRAAFITLTLNPKKEHAFDAPNVFSEMHDRLPKDLRRVLTKGFGSALYEAALARL
ncbi:hypothetical protein PGTUg99_017484 [Puccinia graminis f. sp. tritici]|nr:hypothetical protein PGTUg99_017484 [Puccinia graminis f. sp. tritici]